MHSQGCFSALLHNHCYLQSNSSRKWFKLKKSLYSVAVEGGGAGRTGHTSKFEVACSSWKFSSGFMEKFLVLC